MNPILIRGNLMGAKLVNMESEFSYFWS